MGALEMGLLEEELPGLLILGACLTLQITKALARCGYGSNNNGQRKTEDRGQEYQLRVSEWHADSHPAFKSASSFM